MPMNMWTDTSGPLLSFVFHLDTDKTIDNQPGSPPDPQWLRVYEFTQADMTRKPQGRTNAQYRQDHLDACKREARLLAQEERKILKRAQRSVADLGAPEAVADIS